MRKGFFLSIILLCGEFNSNCSFKIYPPVAHLELIAPIYPDARPENCNLKVLTGPPEEPFEVFAQVVAYAGSEDFAERMEALIKTNACEAGADAIVLLPMQHGAHYNTDNIYPDWITTAQGGGQGERFQHWVDKRYNVGQRALAIVFKRTQKTEQKNSGS
jgi:hypothetical protein